MVASKVIWSPEANRDIRRITNRIKVDRPMVARRAYRTIREKCRNLLEFPALGRTVPELLGVEIYRELVFDPWRIIYRIDGNTIYILAVTDSRRDLIAALGDRIGPDSHQ